jgi:putative dehydrogenase
MRMSKTVGMIGMGIMGGAMARNLAERGWAVFGFDTDAARCAEAKAAGVTVVGSPAAVAEAAPLIITSLPSAAVVRRVAEEIAGTGVAKRIIAECSTLALDDKHAFAAILEKAGHVALDCPLSGTGAQCAVRDLVIYASGDPEGIGAMESVFADIGKKTTNVGVFGNGSRMKYVANHLVAINNVASAEAMLLGVKAGLDPHQIVDLVNAGAAGSIVFGLRAPMMADRTYEPATMRVSTWKKDMTVISAFARELDCPTPMFGATESIYAAALSQGLGALDTAAVFEVYEKLGGKDS